MTRSAPDHAPHAWRLAVGVGCRAGRPAEAIDAAIDAALARLGALYGHEAASRAHIACVATLDAKAGEPGLVACCERHGWPLRAIPREAIAARRPALEASEAPQAFDAPRDDVDTDPATGPRRPSAVQARFGIDGVCEPCALAAAPQGRLLVPKTIVDGVTVAIAGPA
ncbi:cobalamin biosynthesis protein [Burkholderia sp. 22PA0099]|uniref:cobalamin biosynthesis protein n=1 Tax=Burkholderia sp. 22PA0099 TaxID=3237372 RepID=UPI0039C23DBA